MTTCRSALVLDLALPAVDRRHRRVDVDARREALVDERPRQRVGALVVGHRRQDKDEIVVIALVLSREVVVLFSSRAEESTNPDRRRSARTPTAETRRRATGASSSCCCCSSRRSLSSTAWSATAGCSRCCARGRSTTSWRRRSRASAPRTRGCAKQARRLREDPPAIEEIARRELGLIRPGERVFIVKDVPPAKPSRLDALTSTGERRGRRTPRRTTRH